jgi:hypothetical protein
LDVVIPTYGRATKARQHTLRQILETGIEPTLVVQEREAESYHWYAGPVWVLPDHVHTIAPTRDHIIHDMPGSDHVLMLDDDLQFAVRRTDDPTKFRQPNPLDIREMLGEADRELHNHPHIALGSREGGNRNTERFMWNTRMMRALGYSRKFMKERGITFHPMEVMEDFHVTLQILRSGRDCLVLNNWVTNQAGGSDASGGCSTFRTKELHEKNAYVLASRHPGFVKVVKKTTKGAWGGGERTDVVVSWKQARKHGHA